MSESKSEPIAEQLAASIQSLAWEAENNPNFDARDALRALEVESIAVRPAVAADPNDPEIRALNRIVRLIGRLMPTLTPAGRAWLLQRLVQVELRDV